MTSRHLQALPGCSSVSPPGRLGRRRSSRSGTRIWPIHWGMTMVETGHDHGEVAVDQEKPKNLQLVVWGIALSVLFFGTALLFNSLFVRYSDKLLAERGLGVDSPKLLEQRVLEEKRLSSYGYVDQAQGSVHIPIQEGMKKVIEENKR